jgi:hypothetical protein
MVINEYTDPIPHVVVDDFLTASEHNQLLGLIEKSLFVLTPGQIHTPGGDCKVVADFKRNGNAWLDSFDSDIVNIFRNNFFKVPTVTQELDCTNRMHEVLLSRYVAGDFYNWHTDLGGHCTWNYFIFQEPKQFRGGDFVISDAVVDAQIRSNTKTIECVNNRLVIFPAGYQHSVTPVVGEFLDPLSSRYSIQVFFR